MRTKKSLAADQRGMINTLLIPLIVTIVLLLFTAGFAIWAFMGRQDYKDNVDAKIATATAVAVKEAETKKDNEFIEREKQPLRDYKSPSQTGSILIKYPKTWSAYVDETGKGSSELDGYFHPSFVPGTQSDTSYALRLQVVNKSFSDQIKTYDTNVKNGKLSAQPYQPVNVANVVGSRLEGEIASGKQGVVILLPLRDKTIVLSTESDQYKADFDNNILPNLTFTP